MYVPFRDDVESHELEEIAQGVVADFAAGGELVGIEVYDTASKKVDLSKLEVRAWHRIRGPKRLREYELRKNTRSPQSRESLLR
jgi:hypothetical protein